MKINGQVVSGPREEVVVIPKGNNDIVFKAKAVLDYDPFYKLCPQPTPPTITKPGNKTSVDVEDKDYKEEVQQWAEYRSAWMMIKSLEATEGLEWDTVDLTKPETWPKYEDDLRNSGFSDLEITRIVQAIITANGMNQDRIDEATERFLASQQVKPVKG